MDDLKKLLAEMLDGTSFDLSTTEISYDGNSRGLPAGVYRPRSYRRSALQRTTV